MASIEGGQHKRPATPIPRRLQLFRLGSVHLFFFTCAFARSSSLLCSLLSLSSLHPPITPYSITPFSSSSIPSLVESCGLVLEFFPSCLTFLSPSYLSSSRFWIKYRSPFRCSFISLTLVARILKSTIVIVARGG